jgi:hypothetical protein
MPPLEPPPALGAATPPDLKAAPELAVYANQFEVGFNAFEFLLDFAQDYYGTEGMTVVHTRIVTAPAYAKVFRGLLDRSIREYEAAFGAIGALPSDDP